VLGHEIGHVVARHPAGRYNRGMLGQLGAGVAQVLGGLLGGYFVPTDRKLAAMAEKELAGGATTLSADYQRQAQREGGIGALAGLLIVVAVFLMVTKPG
jgi:predicted Zn-dependent protease